MPEEKDSPFGEQHDPGPWRWSRTYEIGDGAYWCLENDESAAEGKTIDPSIILRLSSDNWLGQPFLNNPNARLIAAAPELLQACEAAYAALGFPVDDESLNRVTNQLATAIGKAKR